MFSTLREEFFDIRPSEIPKAVGLSVYFFLVIAVFWVLKPMKRGLIIGYFGEDPIQLLGYAFDGAQAEQLGKVLNMFVAFGVVVAFTWLVRRVARHWVIIGFCAVFGALFAFFASFIGDIDLLGAPGVWSFYVLGDIWTTVMVATFWAFANDLNSGGEAERLYGVVGLGGVIGGFVGATVVSRYVQDVGREPFLWSLLVPLALIAGLVWYIHHREKEQVGYDPCCPDDDIDEAKTPNAALEGAKLVLSSRYLIGIAALLGVYEIVSNIVDFQLGVYVEDNIDSNLARDEFFGFVGQVTSAVSIGVQLFLTSFVMKRFGLRVALLFLPIALFAGSFGFLFAPSLLLVGFLSASDNGLNYSINQSAREALYTPTSKDVKYKAKAFIDMFLQRAAKVFAVALNLGLDILVAGGIRWLSVPVLLLIGAWTYVIRYLGHEFENKKDETDSAAPIEA
ncbi:hypothetical protein CRI94_01265 [Longibacter salinarum]|uniref:ADP,ATP carrier protein n=1 Tax=Longibacter salinarum TaxID=1850348 RepID=A0A2A8D238_9BACT|nr:Npt1/Npt2 family nucleotide transporter [Longibacter salinarum]PEN14950.1 hypothetical protein CRI94_01265 [Longibacter salinarum]